MARREAKFHSRFRRWRVAIPVVERTVLDIKLSALCTIVRRPEKAPAHNRGSICPGNIPQSNGLLPSSSDQRGYRALIEALCTLNSPPVVSFKRGTSSDMSDGDGAVA